MKKMQTILNRFCCLCSQLRNINPHRKLHIGAALYAGAGPRHPDDRTIAKDLYNRRIAAGPDPERHRSVWYNWNYDAELFSFGARLGEKFNKDTLKTVFTHSSYVDMEQKKQEELGLEQLTLQDNTHLIKQGGETIVSFIKAYLRKEFPRLPEDCVRSVCSYLTSEEMLSHISKNIGITDLIHTEEFPVSQETLSDSFKAVVGGLLQDQGLTQAHRFIQDFVLTQLIGRDINELLGIHDPMGLLAAMLAIEGRGEPEPRLLYSSGSETVVGVYMIGIYSDKQLLGKSYGESVPIGEEMAARDALRTHLATTLHRKPTHYSQTIQLHDTNYTENTSIADYLNQGQSEKQKQIQS